MPVYLFECNNCHNLFDNISTMSQRNEPIDCPICGNISYRNIGKELSFVDGSVTENHVRYSWSMGATPEQAKEMLKKYPDLEYKYGKDGGPLLVKNRQHKLELMKRHQMEEW